MTAPRESPWRLPELGGYAGPLLLDTHIWVWHLEGAASRMAPDVVPLLDRSGRAGQLWVCDVSYWEVAMKTAQGKLAFSIDAGIWLRRAEKAPGIRFLPLDRDVLLLSTRLARTVQNDPADRMLLAAALLHNLPLVTADRRIVEYAMASSGIPVVDARA